METLKISSCSPFRDTIRLEGTTVKWSCDTLGFHEEKFDTKKDAKKFIELLKETSLTRPSFNEYCGESSVGSSSS